MEGAFPSRGLGSKLALDEQFETIVGLEASSLSLRQARHMLAEVVSGPDERIRLVAGSYLQKQPTLSGFDAAALVKTIEHFKPEQLASIERSVFAQMQPVAVFITTPNREYNPLYSMAPGQFRKANHKFEWDRAKFRQWSTAVAKRNGYKVTFRGIGEADSECGHPTKRPFFNDKTDSHT